MLPERIGYSSIPSLALGGIFIVQYSMTVNTALAEHAVNELSQTPFSSKRGVRRSNEAIGNTIVPKKDVQSERAGRSNAVK